MKKLLTLISIILFTQNVFSQELNNDSIYYSNKKAEIELKKSKQTQSNFIINSKNILRFKDYSICSLTYETTNSNNPIILSLIENGNAVPINYIKNDNEIILKLPNDKNFGLLLNNNQVVTNISTNAYQANEAIELPSSIYNALTMYMINDNFKNVSIQSYIINAKYVDFPEKLSFLQKHILKGKPMNLYLQTLFENNFTTFENSLNFDVAMKKTRGWRDSILYHNLWDHYADNRDSIISNITIGAALPYDCNCSYVVVENNEILPINHFSSQPYNKIDTSELARQYFPLNSNNDLIGGALNVNPWDIGCGGSTTVAWRDGYRNEFGAAKQVAAWSHGWHNWFCGAGPLNFEMNTIPATLQAKAGHNYDMESYSLICTGNSGFMSECGCQKELTIHFKYDNALSAYSDLDGSSNANSNSYAEASDNAIAYVENFKTMHKDIVDFDISSATSECQMVRTPEWITAQGTMINSMGAVSADITLGVIAASLGVPPHTNLDSLMQADPNFATTFNNVVQTITGQSIANYIHSSVTDITTMINNILAVKNTQKWTDKSCQSSKSEGAYNLIDKTITISLKANEPLYFYLASCYKILIGGQRSFHNSAEINSGGYIASYMRPDAINSLEASDNCCSERYGRWVETTFGPVQEYDYQDEIGNFLSTLNGTQNFYPWYPLGSFANIGVLGNTGRVKGPSLEGCRGPIPIYYRMSKTNNKLYNIIESDTKLSINNIRNTESIMYSILDLNGRILKTGSVNANNILDFDKTNYPTNIYLLEILSSNGKDVYKFKN